MHPRGDSAEIDLDDEIPGASSGAVSSGAVSSAPVGRSVWVESTGSERASHAAASVSVAPRRRRHEGAAQVVLAFAVGAVASLILLTAVAVIVLTAYSNRVAPGVRVGSVDVSGLTRDQVIAKLQAAYAYLGQGEVTVATPIGTATITYRQAGRQADVEFMADSAMRVGHTGEPIGDIAGIVRSAINGESVPIAVRVDPTAVATRLRQLVGTRNVPPLNAQASVRGGTFVLWQSTPGRGLDEVAISSAIIDRLAQPNAPASYQVDATIVALDPDVSDKDARDAIVAAEKMNIDVSLTWSGELPTQSAIPSNAWIPSHAPTPSKAPTPSRIYTVDAQTIRSWIVFGTRADASYGPAADPALVQAYLLELSPKVATPPKGPVIVYDASGNPVGLKGGKDGAGIDVAATSRAIVAHLNSLASGGSPGSAIALIAAPITSGFTLDSVSGMVRIGSWTTIFYPDESNGYGANIRVPATVLNGQVVAPGQRFSFLTAVGPIDPAHGFTWGGVIKGGKSDHTGAMGGGICSASTTTFNAAARAGLQIDERHAHAYYISRYPVGLDATVFSNGSQKLDLKWTNDTPNPILIRARSTYGAKSTITIELWSLPLDRKVTFSPEFKANIVRAGDSKQHVSWLKPGQRYRAEYPTIGFATTRTRTVTDSTGKVVHLDVWNSHYAKVDGILQIGVSKPPTPTPSPGALAPAPGVLTPTRSATAVSGRRLR
jgi:vancomycin resistance protein YoaR